MSKIIVTIPAGNVEYSTDAAATPIQDLIEELQAHVEDGATHVVGLSGNYRGASYVRLGRVDWLDEDEDIED